jgi:hypothetical protein
LLRPDRILVLLPFLLVTIIRASWNAAKESIQAVACDVSVKQMAKLLLEFSRKYQVAMSSLVPFEWTIRYHVGDPFMALQKILDSSLLVVGVRMLAVSRIRAS